MIRLTLFLGLHLQDPSPPGPHLPLRENVRTTSFSSNEKLVATYYFFWYDLQTKEHVVDSDGSDALTDHPPSLEGFSYKNPAWHRRELAEMAQVGIDIALTVYRGVPGRRDWNQEGIEALARALEEMEKAREAFPRVGLFYDTTLLQGVDLTREGEQRRFFLTVRDFYSMIPPRFWAMIDHRPIVWLYSAGFPSKFDAELFDDFRARFRKSFQERSPYVVAEASWLSCGASFENTYQWGAALTGPKIHGVAAVGPGYDDSAVPDRAPSIRSRNNGFFYERSWHAASKSKCRLAVIETWNGFHEGTEICESQEHGRRYLDATKTFVEKFHRGETIPNPKGPYTGSRAVGFNLRYTPPTQGLTPVHAKDGPYEIVEIPGLKLITTKTNPEETWRYLYFDVDDSFAYFEMRSYQLTVEYFDKGTGRWFFHYDSWDPTRKSTDPRYKTGFECDFANSDTFKEVHISLTDPRFGNGQKGSADFRLAVEGRGLAIRRIIVAPK